MMTQSHALAALLSSIGVLPSPARSAENVAADCVTGLSEIGMISVENMEGSPTDVERMIALRASLQGASYYRIIQLKENHPLESWQAQAIIYT